MTAQKNLTFHKLILLVHLVEQDLLFDGIPPPEPGLAARRLLLLLLIFKLLFQTFAFFW